MFEGAVDVPGRVGTVDEDGDVGKGVVKRVHVCEVGNCFVAFVCRWVVGSGRVICDVWNDAEIWNRDGFGPSMGFFGKSCENEVYRQWT